MGLEYDLNNEKHNNDIQLICDKIIQVYSVQSDVPSVWFWTEGFLIRYLIFPVSESELILEAGIIYYLLLENLNQIVYLSLLVYMFTFVFVIQ